VWYYQNDKQLNSCTEITFISRAIPISAKGSTNYEWPCSYCSAISGNHHYVWPHMRMCLFCLQCYWDSIRSYFTHLFLTYF